jgi:hypothetical protein
MREKVFWILLGLSLLPRLLLLLVPVETLIALDIYSDDAFYYLKIAKNIIAGKGMVFNSEIYTNGFQPLYLLLLLPAFIIWPSNLEMPVYYSVLILSFFNVGCGYLIYSLTKKLSSRLTALMALAIWSFSPYFIFNGINGLETSVAAFFALLVVHQYTFWLDKKSSMLPLGVFAGLAFLARIDFLLLGAILLLHYLITVRNIKMLIPGLASFLAVTLPWFIISNWLTGTLIPQSGSASNFIAHCLGWLGLDRVFANNTDPLLFNPDFPPFNYYLDLAVRFSSIALFENPLLSFLRPQTIFSTYVNLGDFSLYRIIIKFGVISFLCMLLLLLIFCIHSWRRFGRNSLFAIFWLIMLLCAYVFTSAAHWYFQRYLYIAMTLQLIYIFSLFAPLRSRILYCLLLLILSINIIHLLSYINRNQIFHPRKDKFLNAWHNSSKLIKPESRIGAFQAGIFNYFGDRDILSLDGKVNPLAFENLKNRTLGKYITSQKLDYIIDSETIIFALFGRFNTFPKLKPISTVNNSTRSILYLVDYSQK